MADILNLFLTRSLFLEGCRKESTMLFEDTPTTGMPDAGSAADDSGTMDPENETSEETPSQEAV